MSENKFRMPGEFEPHDGCLMIWPERPGSWKDGIEAEKAFAAVARAIGRSETVYMMVSPEKLDHAKQVMKSPTEGDNPENPGDSGSQRDPRNSVDSENPRNSGDSENPRNPEAQKLDGAFNGKIMGAETIVFIPFAADDSWARDTGPTFVVSESERKCRRTEA
ncbi:MAG: agmatine deiminase family protein, partial [Lachnospiraceae bacterium]|nr:agmatine deiminase family protein [Lachnospiraceae bacterium]